MRNTLLFLLLSTTLLVSNTPKQTTPLTQLNSSEIIGKEIFRKKLRKKCGFTGARFARYHTSAEWESLKSEGHFIEEIYKICPRVSKNINTKWVDPLYEFSKSYASDTGKYPPC